MLALPTGLLGRLGPSVGYRPRAVADAYAAAYRLLTQLRDRGPPAARRPRRGGAGAQALLQACADAARVSTALRSTSVRDGRLVPLAFAGIDRVDWIPPSTTTLGRGLEHGRPPSRAGCSRQPAHGSTPRCSPCASGVRTIGLVGLERRRRRSVGPPSADRAQNLVDDAALRIETALLFNEVRAIATAEERRRLAREIHDGIAQELASLGYVVDDLPGRATDSTAAQPSCGTCAAS